MNMDILRELAKDNDGRARAYVAANANCPEDILRKLAKDGRWEVREEVA